MLRLQIIILFFALLIPHSTIAQPFQVEQIGPSLKNPWGMDFINDREILITEKRGNIYHINISDGSYYEIQNVPKVASTMQGGLLDRIYNNGAIF